MSSQRFSFRKGDIFAAILVILLAIGVGIAYLPGNTTGGQVEIYQNGQLLETYPLNADRSISIDADFHNTVQIHSGKVAVTASSCPGTDCVHSGWISTPGRSIVCLPNRVEVRIVGTEEADVDFVVG